MATGQPLQLVLRGADVLACSLTATVSLGDIAMTRVFVCFVFRASVSFSFLTSPQRCRGSDHSALYTMAEPEYVLL